MPLALVVVVALGTYAALQVLPDGPAPGVFVVGDSVTYLSAGAIQQQFDPDHLQFVAKPGFTSTMLLPLVRQAMAMSDEPAHDRQRVAALVGYNDVRVREVDTPSLRKLVDLTSEFECGIWLTLPSRPGGANASNPMVASRLVDQWNLRLKAEVARHENLHLVDDWKKAVEAAPPGSLIKDDGIHPNDAGQQKLADIYRAAMDRSC